MPVLRRQFLVAFATCSTVLMVACGPSHEPHVIQPRPRKVTVTVAVPDTTIVEKRQQLAALRWLATFVPVTAIPPTRVAVTGTQTFVHSSESPPTTPAVNPVSSSRCPAGPVKDEIDRVFGTASGWAESIAWRESNCEPTARNASGSAGVFQLLGHSDLLHAACPESDPATSWSVADCNIRAAKSLFDGSGVAPWHL